MRTTATTALGLFLLAFGGPAPAADDDPRTLVALPPDIRDGFLAEMRGHLDTLDDLVAAIAGGDFADAAETADLRLDFGHRMWEAMAESGMPPEQIAEMKARMKAMGMGSGRGMQMTPEQQQRMHDRMLRQTGPDIRRHMGPGGGMGFGRFMPPEFRQMGFAMHEAGQNLTEVLRAAAEPPTATDYANVMDALAGVTVACRGCHAAFRVR